MSKKLEPCPPLSELMCNNPCACCSIMAEEGRIIPTCYTCKVTIMRKELERRAATESKATKVYAKTAMSKMPDSCTECGFGRRYGCVGDVKCLILNTYFTSNTRPPYKERPDECPLADNEIVTEANEPLTLEELREMDGDPVWCEDGTVDAGIVRMAEDWATERKEPHIWMFDKYGDVKCYNIRLMLEQGAKFYRCPPEGGEG